MSFNVSYIAGGRFDYPRYFTNMYPYVKGLMLEVPAETGVHTVKEKISNDRELAAVGFTSQPWYIVDNWSLYIDDKIVVDSTYTKHLPEALYLVNVDSIKTDENDREITLAFNNESGESKRVWITLHFIVNELYEFVVEPGRRLICGVIDVTEGTDELVIESNFAETSGAMWPDLNVRGPYNLDWDSEEEQVGEWFGYMQPNLNTSDYDSTTDIGSADKAEYSGYYVEPPEYFIFKNPIPGPWLVEVRAEGANAKSVTNIDTNIPFSYKNLTSQNHDSKDPDDEDYKNVKDNDYMQSVE